MFVQSVPDFVNAFRNVFGQLLDFLGINLAVLLGLVVPRKQRANDERENRPNDGDDKVCVAVPTAPSVAPSVALIKVFKSVIVEVPKNK